MLTLRLIITVFLLLMLTANVLCQDTLFVKRHVFEETVHNVFEVYGKVHVKTSSKLFILDENDQWLEVNHSFKTRYVYHKNGELFGLDGLGDEYNVVDKGFYKLIPTRNFLGINSIAVDNRIFVVADGQLYEYKVDYRYKKELVWTSVRSICTTKNNTYVGTYDGLYTSEYDMSKIKRDYNFKRHSIPKYMNGRIVNHMNHIFLCADDLLELGNNGQIYNHRDIYSFEDGYQRDLVVFKGNLYSLNTMSITRFDSLKKKMVTVSKGHKYTSIEAVGENLLFGTKDGLIFKLSNVDSKPELILNLNSEITDFHTLFNNLYIASFNQGIFVCDTANINSTKLIFKLINSVSINTDRMNNLYIGTENGLYINPESQNKLITYIPSVEFNRFATARNQGNGHLYFGSTSGLYIIKLSDVEMFIENLSKKSSRSSLNDESWPFLISIFSYAILIGVIVFLWFKYRNVKNNESLDNLSGVGIDEIKKTILTENIQTVEHLAEFYNTNTVRLNRFMKKFYLTPGTVLREVKLQKATSMKEQGESIETISAVTGYSARYLINYWNRK